MEQLQMDRRVWCVKAVKNLWSSQSLSLGSLHRCTLNVRQAPRKIFVASKLNSHCNIMYGTAEADRFTRVLELSHI